MAATPSVRRFADRHIRWQTLGDFEHREGTLLKAVLEDQKQAV